MCIYTIYIACSCLLESNWHTLLWTLGNHGSSPRWFFRHFACLWYEICLRRSLTFLLILVCRSSAWGAVRSTGLIRMWQIQEWTKKLRVYRGSQRVQGNNDRKPPDLTIPIKAIVLSCKCPPQTNSVQESVGERPMRHLKGSYGPSFLGSYTGRWESCHEWSDGPIIDDDPYANQQRSFHVT